MTKEELENTESVHPIIKDWRMWEDCILSFIRSEHLRERLGKHIEIWNQDYVLPPSAYQYHYRDQQTSDLQDRVKELEEEICEIHLKVRQAINTVLLENLLSKWKDNGECREYEDLTLEDTINIGKEVCDYLPSRAGTKVANEIVIDSLKSQLESQSALIESLATALDKLSQTVSLGNLSQNIYEPVNKSLSEYETYKNNQNPDTTIPGNTKG